MKYRVHVYAVVRVPIEVEAESQAEAIAKADEVNLHAEVRSAEAEYAEQVTGYLVDEIGDEGYTNTRSYDAHGQLERPKETV